MKSCKHKLKKKSNSKEKKQIDEKEFNKYSQNLSCMDYIEKSITSDGNCFFRAISYYFREKEDFHLEFRQMLYE